MDTLKKRAVHSHQQFLGKNHLKTNTVLILYLKILDFSFYMIFKCLILCFSTLFVKA